jgi:hypothetical protein
VPSLLKGPCKLTAIPSLGVYIDTGESGGEGEEVLDRDGVGERAVRGVEHLELEADLLVFNM